MNLDIFRTGGMSFEQWVEANDLSKAPSEELERFRSALDALQKNAALKFILNGMEIEAMSRVYVGNASDLDANYRDLQAVKRFRRLLEGHVQDRAVSLQKRGK
jgi:hypothetical protein